MKGLLITYFYPPANAIASHRVYSFAKYLNNSKDTLDVLCPEWEGTLNFPRVKANYFLTPAHTFDPNFGEVRVSGLRKLKKIIVSDILKLNLFRSRKPGRFYYEVMDKLQSIDLSVYDYVITSYAPLDCIHIGHYIKSKYPSIKWIIDYRDLYSLLEYTDFGWATRNFRKFEKEISCNADAFITVSETLCLKQKKLLQLPSEVIFNGFDDYNYETSKKIEEEFHNFHLPVISYAGSLYKGERDVIPFFKFMHSEGLDEKFITYFAIINDFDQQYLEESIQKTQIKNVKIVRNLNYAESMTLQKLSAFVVMFSNFGGRANGYLTGKLFEYMQTGRPIIYSGTAVAGYELYDMIKKYRLGESFDNTDFKSYEGFTAADCSAFHRKTQAEKLHNFIEGILNKNG